MCLGLGNGCVPKEELTMITCVKCGKSWQVKESDAEHFNAVTEGVCVACRSHQEEKKTSLLKPYTNFENLKAMNINEMAEFLHQNSGCSTCAFSDVETGRPCGTGECIEGRKQWLMQEAKQ